MFFPGRENEACSKGGYNVATEVKSSGVPAAGRGRFACQDIPKGTIIRSVKAGGAHMVAYKTPAELEAVGDWDWVVNFIHTPADDTDMAKKDFVYGCRPMHYHNHSLEPNCFVRWADDCRITVALRDIKSGEEFFENYVLFGKVNWYEDFLHSKGNTSVRELPELIKNFEDAAADKRGGYYIETEVKPSTIQGAGRGRFAMEDAA